MPPLSASHSTDAATDASTGSVSGDLDPSRQAASALAWAAHNIFRITDMSSSFPEEQPRARGSNCVGCALEECDDALPPVQSVYLYPSRVRREGEMRFVRLHPFLLMASLAMLGTAMAGGGRPVSTSLSGAEEVSATG